MTVSNDGKLGFVDLVVKDNDQAPKEQRLPWFQTFMHVLKFRLDAAGDKMSLQAIGHSNILNSATRKTIDSIFTSLGSTAKGDWIRLNHDAPANSDESHAFEAMTRTDNGKGAYWLLGAHRNAFQDKIVTQIWIRRRSADALANDDTRNMLIVLGTR